VLSLINLKKVQKDGFKKTESGAVIMSDETRKEVLVSYQNRKQEEMTHPFIGEKIHVGMLFHIQALLFSRYMRGELDAYPPFIWR
jgi:CRISPR-associated protein Cas1